MLSFDEIEDCLPMGGGTTDDGSVIVSAQWLHDFAHAVAAKEREACADAAREFLTKGRSPLGKAVHDAIMARSNAVMTGPKAPSP